MDSLETMITPANHDPDMAGGCFPKGTPITVKGGWKPIEEIKVGDYVLSSPEDGSGKPEYKRVVKTTKHEKKTIREIGFGWNPTKMSLSTMAATGNHPFWVEGVGWTRADLLKEGDLLRKADGSFAEVAFQYPIYQFHNPSTGETEPGTGWVQMVEELDMMLNPASGFLFDYENHRFLPKGENIGELDWDDMTEENHLKVTVYNLEVEDFHTYYVGGIWVHNPAGYGKAPFTSAKDANEYAIDNTPANGTRSRKQDVAGGCFPKGTRVHTKEGLKPIEEIEVGDWVLSAPEDGSGKPEYKRVVKTVKHEKKTIRKIGYDWDSKKMSLTLIAVTGNHPFWVEGVGWTRADLLKEGNLLRKADGSLTKVEFQYPVYQFHNPSTGEPEPGVGWVQMVEELDMMLNPATGDLFDYENYRLLSGDSEGELDWDDMTEENYLKVTVYNLEVEDFHTYYVGRGLWVHNIDCAEKCALDPGQSAGLQAPRMQMNGKRSRKQDESARIRSPGHG